MTTFCATTTYLQIEEYRDLDRRIKALTKDKENLSKELKAGYFLHYDDFVHEGRLIATYRPQIHIRFDQARFQTDNPDTFKAYQEITTRRVFLLK